MSNPSNDAEDAALAEAEAKFDTLRGIIQGCGRLAVAFSGGLDSAFLLFAARRFLGSDVLAVTIDAEAIPRAEIGRAAAFTSFLGVEHVAVRLSQLALPEFRENGRERCYHCKRALFRKIVELAHERGFRFVADGSNVDDRADYRPGRKATAELEILSPLEAAGFSKRDIRALSRKFALPTAELASFACLASRVPYGTAITAEILRRVETVEEFLARSGFRQYRARHHGDMLRIELPVGDMAAILDENFRTKLIELARKVGYAFVTVDLEGYRTGSLNESARADKKA